MILPILAFIQVLLFIVVVLLLNQRICFLETQLNVTEHTVNKEQIRLDTLLGELGYSVGVEKWESTVRRIK